MTLGRQPTHVRQVDGHRIVVEVNCSEDEVVLLELGFRLHQAIPNWIFEMAVSSDTGTAFVFSKLRDAGIAFSSGREWCPAEVFEWLRGQGLVHGAFRSIAWHAPGQWIIRQELQVPRP